MALKIYWPRLCFLLHVNINRVQNRYNSYASTDETEPISTLPIVKYLF